MIKLIFSDMDGTLLDEQGQIPEGFADMLAELKKRGCKFVAASGRQYWALLKQFDKYKDDMLFLAENGTYIGSAIEEYACNPIDLNTAKEICARILNLKNGTLPILCGKQTAYAIPEWNNVRDQLDKYYYKSVIVDDLQAVDDVILKVAVGDFEVKDATNTIYKHFPDLYEPLQVSVSGSEWVDFMAKGVNKGNGVKLLQEKLGIKPEECAAFGDFMNDYEMMQAVYYSYAMENACDDLKKVARFTCKSNKEYGVIQQVNQLIAEGMI